MTEEKEPTQEDDDWAFRCLADAYPHEMHEHDPDRFWAYFQTRHPGWTREQMIALLEETKE